MNIIINAASIFKGGAEQVAHSFISECKKFGENEYHVFLRSNIKDHLDTESFPGNFFFYDIQERPGSGVSTLIKTLRYFDKLEKEIQPDAVVSTGGHGYWKPKTAPIVVGFNIPHFIYPESPYFSKIGLKGKVRWTLKKKIHMYLYGRADAIVGQTDDVRDRVSRLLPDIPAYTISNTVNGCFYEPKPFPDKLPSKEIGEFRLLTVSSYYPHKNLDIINSVIEELKRSGSEKVKFVLTLPGKDFKRCISPENRSRVYNIGPIPITECPSLYNECDAMFLPTLLECFSASYAEAMVMGKPILTSDLGFAHTVCKDAAIYFNPVNAKDISEKIAQIKENMELQKRLKNRGTKLINTIIKPEERAEKYLELCDELIRD